MDPNSYTKEKILRRLLQLRGSRASCSYTAKWEIINRLSRLLEQKGDAVGSIELLTKHTIPHMDNPESAVILNSLALKWRSAGRPYEAELLLRQAREIETRLLPEDSCKHPHRLNNLSTVLIMQGRLEEARHLLRRAWKLMKGRHDVTSVRILISRVTICFLESNPPDRYIGWIKTLLYDRVLEVAGNITTTTNAAVMVDYLKEKLPIEHYQFLHSLFRAANDLNHIQELERYTLWQTCPALMLDGPAPIDPVQGGNE